MNTLVIILIFIVVILILTLIGLGIYYLLRKKNDPTGPTGPTGTSFTYTSNGLVVSFKDTSTNNPTGWLWDFGDGSTKSTLQNPNHTYSKEGSYLVNLTATTSGGTNSSSKNITVGSGNSTGVTGTNFSYTPNNLVVNFKDTSTNNPTAWLWDFGDSSTKSTIQNPIHTYTKEGNYLVNLTVTTSGGTGSTSKNITIENGSSGGVTGTNFSYTPTDLVVNFKDTSTNNPTSWNWIFGDSSTNSTIQNPTHTYSKEGTYAVNLTVTTLNGTGSISKNISVNNAPSGPTGLTNAPFTSTSSALSQSFSGVWNPQVLGDGLLLFIEATESTTSCSNYTFKYQTYTVNNTTIPGALVWQGDEESLIGSVGVGNNISVSNPLEANSNVNFSWTFDPERLTWHPSNNSSLVMKPNSIGAVPSTVILAQLPPNFDTLSSSTKEEYQWINGNLPRTSALCTV